MLGSRNHIDSHEAVRAMLASTRSNRDPMPFERHCRPHQSLVGSSTELLDLEAEAGVRRSRARSRLRTSLRDRHQQRVIVERDLVSRFVNRSLSLSLSLSVSFRDLSTSTTDLIGISRLDCESRSSILSRWWSTSTTPRDRRSMDDSTRSLDDRRGLASRSRSSRRSEASHMGQLDLRRSQAIVLHGR